MKLLVAEKYSLTFAGLNFVSNLNFSFEKGGIYRLVGPTGRGKTLFLFSLIQLIPAQYSKLELNEQACSKFTPEIWRTKVLYLPQTISLSGEKVRDTLKQPFMLKVHQGKKLDDQKLEEYLRFLDFNPNTFPNAATAGLSGGESQVVSLLRALLLKPDILLADESWSAMDQNLKQRMISLLKKELGHAFQALVFITHDETNYFEQQNNFDLSFGLLSATAAGHAP